MFSLSLYLQGSNWVVCLAYWLSTIARDLNSKIIGIYLPIWLFIAVGGEHSIANMLTVRMGMILSAKLSILRVLIPATLGNILGGGVFVGFTYWYLYFAQKADTGIKTDIELQNNRPYQIVKQNESGVRSQQP